MERKGGVGMIVWWKLEQCKKSRKCERQCKAKHDRTAQDRTERGVVRRKREEE